jgi:hypothetical protein
MWNCPARPGHGLVAGPLHAPLHAPAEETDDMIDRRSLGRATLERQLLLRRSRMPVEDAVEHLIAMQSQLPSPPYFGLWTRLEGFRHEALTELMTRRRVVRGCLLRGTLHVCTARDFLALRPVLQPVLERCQRGFFRRDTEGMDLGEFAGFTAKLLEDEPMTGARLRGLLGERWPERQSSSLINSVQFLVPTVYVPPGGTWGTSGSMPITTAPAWLGQPLGTAADPAPLVLRYLAAFGPATLKDIQAWSGLTRMKPVLDRLRPELFVDRDERGAELFDRPDAPRPDAGVPAPVRFLPDYDNLLVAHADRTRVISDEDRRRTNTSNGIVAATVLVDGEVGGTWRIARGSALEVRLFRPVPARLRDEIAAEGTALLDFAAGDSTSTSTSINFID